MHSVRVGIVAALSGVALAVGFAVPAFASDSGDIYGITNSNRAAAGLGGLNSNGSLASVAQAWANQMAANQSMSHNPNVANQVPRGWQAVGENVATGFASGADTMNGWMNSSGHRANILGNYTDIGVGWTVDGNGVSWAVQVFARYPGSAPAPASGSAASGSAASARRSTAPAAGSRTSASRAAAAQAAAAQAAADQAAADAAAAQAAAEAAAAQAAAEKAAAERIGYLAADNKPRNPAHRRNVLQTVSADGASHGFAGDANRATRAAATSSSGGTDEAVVGSLLVLIVLMGGALVSRLRRRGSPGR